MCRRRQGAIRVFAFVVRNRQRKYIGQVARAVSKHQRRLRICLEETLVYRAYIRAVRRAGIEDLRFHDLRHEATTRLFEQGLNIMEVASITGHKDLRMLRRYTHLKAEDLAKKLG